MSTHNVDVLDSICFNRGFFMFHPDIYSLFYLTLDKHGHIHEHVVEFLDGGLQLDDVCVPRLNVCQGLLGCCCVHDNALKVKLVFQ